MNMQAFHIHIHTFTSMFFYFLFIIFFIDYFGISHHEPRVLTYYAVLLGSMPTLLSTLSSKKEKEENEKIKSNLYCPYTYWSMVNFPVASPVKKTGLLPHPHPHQASSVVESYISASLSQF
jgi:small neutral amino acid transporter SnatA (MarC family)